MVMKMELRFQNVELQTNKGDLLTVSGYVNKTNQLSNVLGVSKKFREKIAKGAFARAIKRTNRDVDFLAEHNSKLILASTRNGSLTLLEDDEGLYMSATIAPTSWGKDYYELINSGILKNMSFGFRTIKDSWKANSDGIYERTIEDLELYEVSVVKDPAYSQSTISARGIDLVEDVSIPSSIKVTKKQTRNNVNIKNEERIHKMRQYDLELEKNNDNKQFETFLREHRNLQTTVEGSGLIPSSVSKDIILKMEETSPVFARAKKFPSVYGSLTITREDDLLEAGFVGVYFAS